MDWIIAIIFTLIFTYFVFAEPLQGLILVITIYIIYLCYKKYKKSNAGRKKQIEKNIKKVEQAKEIQKRLNQAGVYPTHIVACRCSILYFDENNRKLYLDLPIEKIVLDFDEITNFEITSNKSSNIQYTLGTYFTGKFKRNEVLENMNLYIYINSISRPYIKVPCFDGISAYDANEFANKAIGALNYIKNNVPTTDKPVLNIIPDLETEFIPIERKPIPPKTKKALLISLIAIITILIAIFIGSNIKEKISLDNKIKSIANTKEYKKDISLNEILKTKDYGSLAYYLLFNNELNQESYLALIESNDEKIYNIFNKVTQKNLDSYYENYTKYTEEFINYTLTYSEFKRNKTYEYLFRQYIEAKDIDSYKLLISNKGFDEGILEYFNGGFKDNDDQLDTYERFEKISKDSKEFMLANIEAGHCNKMRSTYYTDKEVMEKFLKCSNNNDEFSKKIINSFQGSKIYIFDIEGFIQLGGNINIFNDDNKNLSFAVTTMSYENERVREVMNLLIKNKVDLNAKNNKGYTVADKLIYDATEYNYCFSNNEYSKKQCNQSHSWYKLITANGGKCNRLCNKLEKLKW